MESTSCHGGLRQPHDDQPRELSRDVSEVSGHETMTSRGPNDFAVPNTGRVTGLDGILVR